MISFTKLNLYNIFLIIPIIILIFLNVRTDDFINLNNAKIIQVTNNQTKEITEEVKDTKVNKENNWSIEIPAINLKANIAEGTTDEVMNEYVGHFENTDFWTGNVGLAAHNRRISSKLFWKT